MFSFRDRQQAHAPTSSEGFSNFQIKDLYTNCIQLSAANVSEQLILHIESNE